jgi:hypothetical protein
MASADEPKTDGSSATTSKRGKKQSRGSGKSVRKNIVAAIPRSAVKSAVAAETIQAAPAALPPAVVASALPAAAPVAAISKPLATEDSGSPQAGTYLLVGGVVLIAAGIGVALWRRRRPLELPPE